jgi:ribose transport system permease protein
MFTFKAMSNARAVSAILALGVMIPLAAKHYDLSGASILGISQILAIGLQVHQGVPWPIAVLAIIAIGGIIGLVNGLLVVRFGIDSFIATLGTGTFLYGLNQWYTGGTQIIGVLPEGFTSLSGFISGVGVPVSFIFTLFVGAVLWILFEYHFVGRHLYVLGDNPKAAELIGIPTGKYVCAAFIASGVLAAIAGIILQAQLRTGDSTIGSEFLLPAFTAVLLGATSVRPGRPNAVGTLLATAALAVIVAGLGQLGVPFFVEPLFNGAMLVGSVGLSVAVQRRRDRSRLLVPQPQTSMAKAA